MTLCQEDANITGGVSLFIGIEAATEKWTLDKFLTLGKWCLTHGVETLFIKGFQVGSDAGDVWYSWIDGGFNSIFTELQKIGILAIPYGYSYALDVKKDINITLNFLQQNGIVCLDIEGATWQGNSNVAYMQQWASALENAPGKLWLSLPANFVQANQQAVFSALAPAVNVFMPMAYTDYLASVAIDQVHIINPTACIQPTLDLSGEFTSQNVGNNVTQIAQTFKDKGILAVSLWYEKFAQENATLVDEIVKIYGGSPTTTQGNTMSLELSKYSEYGVCEVRLWPQLVEGEENLCGIAAAVALDNAVAPNQALTVTPENLDVAVDQVCQDVFHIDPKSFPGVMPDDMLKILTYLRDKKAPEHQLHWQVIPPTMDNIYLALEAGYPLIGSWNEKDSTAWYKKYSKWVHAVPWILSAGHVAPIIGYEPSTKNLLIADQLNNLYQEYWPVLYKAYTENNIPGISNSLSWLAVIKTPWLQSIPDANLANWPKGFNAQTKGNTPVTTSPPTTNAVSPSVNTLTLNQSVVMLGDTTISHEGTTVNHGLGRKPVLVLPLLDSGYSRDDTISVNYGKMDDKTFIAYSSVQTSGNVKFLVL